MKNVHLLLVSRSECFKSHVNCHPYWLFSNDRFRHLKNIIQNLWATVFVLVCFNKISEIGNIYSMVLPGGTFQLKWIVFGVTFPTIGDRGAPGGFVLGMLLCDEALPPENDLAIMPVRINPDFFKTKTLWNLLVKSMVWFITINSPATSTSRAAQMQRRNLDLLFFPGSLTVFSFK